MSDEKTMNYCDQKYEISIGIEAETNICVFDPTTKLIKLGKTPLSCEKNLKCKEEYKDGWTISLEKDYGLPKCLHILEGQIGVSCSMDDKKINKEKLKEQIDSFSKFWDETIKDLKINIDGIDYPILLRHDDIYCNGIPEIEKIKNISIAPQITIGLKIEYIYYFFNFIKKKYEELLKKMDNNEYITYYYYLINFIYESIDFTEDYLKKIFFKDTLEFNESDLNEIGIKFYNLNKKDQYIIIGFLILLNYNNITFEKYEFRKTYLKSWFMLKLRTNIYEFYAHHHVLFERIFDDKIKKDLEKLNKNFKTKELFEWSYPYKNSYNIFIEIRDLKKLLLVCNDEFYEQNIKIKDIFKPEGFLSDLTELKNILHISNIEELEYYVNAFIYTLEESLKDV
jgi:hypothetical protein